MFSRVSGVYCGTLVLHIVGMLCVLARVICWCQAKTYLAGLTCDGVYATNMPVANCWRICYITLHYITLFCTFGSGFVVCTRLVFV